jgi:hypothetical protein
MPPLMSGRMIRGQSRESDESSIRFPPSDHVRALESMAQSSIAAPGGWATQGSDLIRAERISRRLRRCSRPSTALARPSRAR